MSDPQRTSEFSVLQRGEQAMALARVLVIFGFGIRYVTLEQGFSIVDPKHAWVTTQYLLGLVIAALLLRKNLKSPRVDEGFLVKCALFDAVFCALSLLEGGLWPDPTHSGVLQKPGFSVFCLLIVASGLRGSPRVLIVSIIANALAIAMSAMVDYWVNPNRVSLDGQSVAVPFILVIGSSTFAVGMCMMVRSMMATIQSRELQSRCMMTQTAKSAAELHDSVNTLSRALVCVDDLLVQFEQRKENPQDAMRIKGELSSLARSVNLLKEEASLQCAYTEEIEIVNLSEIIRDSAFSYETWLSPMQIEWVLKGIDLHVKFSGGQVGVRRLLQNLLLNAKEGNGLEGARCCIVKLCLSGMRIRLEISDNGPGFDESSVLGSTKTRGAGTGLKICRALVESSLGELQFVRESGWTRCRVSFPFDPLSQIGQPPPSTSAAEDPDPTAKEP